jgi:hypothetical protein
LGFRKIASAVSEIYHRFIAYLFIAINIYRKRLKDFCFTRWRRKNFNPKEKKLIDRDDNSKSH